MNIITIIAGYWRIAEAHIDGGAIEAAFRCAARARYLKLVGRP